MSQVDVRPALAHFNIRNSYVAGVQDVAQLIDLSPDLNIDELDPKLASDLKALNKVTRAERLVKDIFGADLKFKTYEEALLTAQALVEHAAKNDGVIEDVEMAVMAAQARVAKFMAQPENRWLFVKPEGTYSKPITTEQREIIEGTTTEVRTNDEGKLKKGEKGRLAEQMYVEYLANDPRAKDPTQVNQAFIQLLMEKLGMSRAGATTYNYNMKQKYNASAISPKAKRA